MKILPEFMKNTMIGGVIFLLPLGIGIFVISELLDVLSSFADALADIFFPGSDSPFLTTAISLAILIAAAFLAGLIARTGMGGNLSETLRRFATSNIPGFAMINQTVSEMSGASEQMNAKEKLRIVKVDIGGAKRLGAVRSQIGDDEWVVFLPGAPSVFAGIVVIVKENQITDVQLSPNQLMHAMRFLGQGLDSDSLS